MNLNQIWSQKDSVFLETNLIQTPTSRNFLFLNPKEVLIAYTLIEAEQILTKIEDYIQKGYYLAGYLSYELGYLFEPIFRKNFELKIFPFPLIWFGAYQNPIIENITKIPEIKEIQNDFHIPNLSFGISEEVYVKKILTILDHIKRGETYQVNFTFPLHFTFTGNLTSFYNSLKNTQKTSYSAFINDGEKYILSFSPELFFKRTNNTIISKPMKGTLKRGKSELDDVNKIQEFKSDPKIKAENSIIVDLIRNDLSKVSKIGSVLVQNLLEVEEYETLFQMTSTIKSEIKPTVSYYELFKAIFPGGSITGAPKIKTIQILQNLEDSQRGIYTGAIGFISKEESIFNLAIRTIEIKGNKGKMGIGSGIVWDSNPKKEYEECILKQRFLQNTIHFHLIETLLFKNQNFSLLNLHLKRLEKSLTFFGFLFDREKIELALTSLKNELIKNSEHSRYKVRLEVSPDGNILLEHSKISKAKQSQNTIKLNPVKIDSKNIFQSHKTTNRNFYNQEYKKAINQGLIDFFYENERGEIVESSIYNLILKIGNAYYTPPISSGALPGVMREYLIQKGKLKEKVLTYKELEIAEKIFICNSVRGITRVNLFPPAS